MNFKQKLNQAWQISGSFLTVGLDPDPCRLPQEFAQEPDGIFRFCREIVDATAPYACSFKLQIAYFAANRAEGQLEALCSYIRACHPALPIILDAKRGDIGPTAAQYAREAFERYQADATTVSPYMGRDSIEPYLRWRDRGIFVLCRTSNPGSTDVQSLLLAEKTPQEPLYLHIARLVTEEWDAHEQCGLVVGATHPHELAAVRQCVGPKIPLLIPGVGTQGASIPLTVQQAQNEQGSGMLINVSRAILYASNDIPHSPTPPHTMGQVQRGREKKEPAQIAQASPPLQPKQAPLIEQQDWHQHTATMAKHLRDAIKQAPLIEQQDWRQHAATMAKHLRDAINTARIPHPSFTPPTY